MTGVQWFGLWVVLACVLLGAFWLTWEHGHRTGRREVRAEADRLAAHMHTALSERLKRYAPHDAGRSK